MSLTLEDLSLQKSDRATLVGGTGAGKSTLARFLLANWQREYCHPSIPTHKRGRLLILDTKPRWRATQSLTGKTPRARYRNFAPGDTMPGVILESMKDWELTWNQDLNPIQSVIAQNPGLSEDANVRWQVEAAARFFKTQKFSRPSLLYVDEGMDFFGPTGNSRYGNAIQRCYRAGRELGMATCIGVQRPKTINIQTLTEANILFLFRLEFDEDVTRLREMGWPKGEPAPQHDHVFRYLNKGMKPRLYPKPLRLAKGIVNG